MTKKVIENDTVVTDD